jgi:hypothetical protein
MENRAVNPRYPRGWILLQIHADLSSRLIEGYIHGLTEDCSKQIFECGDQITLLRVGH